MIPNLLLNRDAAEPARANHLRWAMLAGLGLALAACSSETSLVGTGVPDNGGLAKPDGGTHVSCATPNTGCACDNPGNVIDCGEVQRRTGDYVSCSMGRRTCGTDGTWGTCLGDRIAPLVLSAAAGKRLQDLGVSSTCIGTPCDPYCQNYVDDSNGLDAGPPCAVTEAGLTLFEQEAAPPVLCTGLQLVPPDQTVVVTSISPMTTLPASIQYQAQMIPVGCKAGFVPATWTLNSYDSALIDANGVLSLYTPVARVLTVSGYSGAMNASGTATILVNVNDTTQAPAGTADKFTGPGVPLDPMTVIYPYVNTVFPRGLAAPIIQWQTNGVAADAVKVSLRYPSTGSPTFTWSNVIAEAALPKATIPQAVWAAFDQTASGVEAAYVVQRLIGGTLYAEVVRKIKFSNAPLRGTIYYTEYGRSSSNPLPSPAIGGNCSFNITNAYIRALDPTGVSAPVNPFATVAPGGCPVCHSVSANGKMFVTSDRGWGTGGGVSRINADGTFTPIANSPQPTNPGVDSRGFSYGAITPAGSYVLQGSNLWGNTITEGSVAVRMSAGNGNGLKAQYFNNMTLTGPPVLSRVDQAVAFDWGTGSPDPAVASDAFSVRWTGQVQGFATEAYTFETESEDGVRLWIDGVLVIDEWLNGGPTKYTATVNLTAGTKYAIVLEYFNNTGAAVVKLRWSSATTPYDFVPQTQLYGR
jgi:hypothetical protein